MEPITHFLTGACIGRAGLNRKTGYATLAATLAAEAADLDIFWGLAGPVEELKHHRGITHTFLGVPFVAAAATGAIWLFHLWWESRRRRQAAALNREVAVPAVPVRWAWVYLRRLDRRAQPHPSRLDQQLRRPSVFSIQPALVRRQLCLHRRTGSVACCFSWRLIFPWLFGLADTEIGVRRTQFRGRGWAIFAL
jgi:inner membrane protein